MKNLLVPKHNKRSRLQETIGVIAILGCLYLAVSLFTYYKWDRSLFTFSDAPLKNYGGIVGAYISDIIFSFFGLSGYLIPVFLAIYGIRKFLVVEKNMAHVFGVLLFLSSLSMFLQLLLKPFSLHIDPPGGLSGVFLSTLFVGLLSGVGAYMLGVALILISLILMSPISLFSYLSDTKKKEKQKAKDLIVVNNRLTVPPPLTGHLAADKSRDAPTRNLKDNEYNIPSLRFLKDAEGASGPTKEEFNTAASLIEKKLSDFGVKGKIKRAHPGPVVAMYEFEPAAGVKINRIVSLSDDLALSLCAPSIRVYPIAGKATMGIEVPNKQRAIVFLKEIITSEVFQKKPSLLTLALGKDIFGNPLIADLSKMPHLLVAGTTGSGKSVFMNSLVISMLYKATPDEVKMLMIDPKLLELSSYNNIPHLISPVVNDPKEASDALKKVVFEMEKRYRLLAERGARNIESYNMLVSQSEKLPYIVVFIDELADLMFTAPRDVEGAITRLAQMARASGIHLILATQRPSVDVITGLIKANFPARISFQVTSKIDSRTILDSQGAEQLLGRGDMLFMLPGTKIIRIHGAYVGDTEVNKITEFVKSQGVPEYSSFQSIVINEQETENNNTEEQDEMYQNVVDFAESTGEVSISSIQRRFKIGYNKAATIMDLLEKNNLVGPPKGAGKPRDFLGRR